MRTILRLDNDVVKLLNREILRSGVSFEEAVNHHLRLALTQKTAKKKFWLNRLP